MLYLSDEWIEAMAAALTEAAPVTIPLTIGYSITGGPEGDRRYSLVCGKSQPTCLPGLARPSVTFKTDWATAVAVARGSVSPQKAFLDGALVLTGDANILIGQQEAVARFDPLLETVRSQTVYE